MQQCCYNGVMETPSVGLALGSWLRDLIERLDSEVATLYADLGLAGFRPRYTPIVRALAALGPSPIRDLAQAVGVTHSAASQTVAQMARDGLVTQEPGDDARQRIVHLAPMAIDLLPKLDYEWRIFEEAVRRLDGELPYPLTEVVVAALGALERRSFHERVVDVMESDASDGLR